MLRTTCFDIEPVVENTERRYQALELKCRSDHDGKEETTMTGPRWNASQTHTIPSSRRQLETPASESVRYLWIDLSADRESLFHYVRYAWLVTRTASPLGLMVMPTCDDFMSRHHVTGKDPQCDASFASCSLPTWPTPNYTC